MENMAILNVGWGTTLENACAAAIEIAARLNISVQLIFNDTSVLARAGDTPEGIANTWSRHRGRTSPLGILRTEYVPGEVMNCPKCNEKTIPSYRGSIHKSEEEGGGEKATPDEWTCLGCNIIWAIHID